MVIISDLHIGNPFSEATKQVIPFIKWAVENNYSVCINGDGLEIAQASFSKLVRDLPDFFKTLAEIRRKGKEIYYVTGNHDIALEHFLEDWGVMKVTPFLNVHSLNTRIRIEHGHIYDPFFVKHPELYEFLTHFAGFLLKIHPSIYKYWIKFEKIKSWMRSRSKVRVNDKQILGEHPHFFEAAYELSRRGFDYVVFGHTHHAGEVILHEQSKYLNPGSWMLSRHFVAIENGKVELKEWNHSA